jgi:hypothetical protein
MTHTLEMPPPLEGPPAPPRHAPAAPPLARTDVPPSLEGKMALAEQLAMAQGSLFPEWLRGRAPNFLAVMFAAQALDIPVWTAAQGLYAEGGSVGVEASLMRALVQRAGHLFYIEDSSPFHATAVVVRWNVPDRPYRKTFTMEEAVRMGLGSLEHYQRNPEAQMIARATSAVCREGAADTLAGFTYTPEEIQHGFRQDKTPAAPPPVTVEAATVERLCADIDAAEDLPAVRKAWKATAKAGALTATCDGESLVSRLQAKFAAVAPGTPVEAAVLATPRTETTTAPVMAAPAPEPNAPCGCPKAEFLRTGTHQPSCSSYAAPVTEPPPAPKAAAPKTAAKAAAKKAAPAKRALRKTTTRSTTP